jgi:hypothetical protein
MRCDEVYRLFPEYLIDELPESERRAVRDHISRCAGCRYHLERMETALRLISMEHAAMPPDSYFARFPRRVMERIGTTVLGDENQRRHGRLYAILVMSGTVAAALSLLLLFMRPGPSLFGPDPNAYRYTPTEIAVVDAGFVDELSIQGLDSLDVSETSGVDLLLNGDPWEALPDLSDEEMEMLLTEFLNET